MYEQHLCMTQTQLAIKEAQASSSDIYTGEKSLSSGAWSLLLKMKMKSTRLDFEVMNKNDNKQADIYQMEQIN